MITSLSRRELLGSVGALASSRALGADLPRNTLKLRILATSDLHMFALDWDYYRARQDVTVGLSRVASLIQIARAEAANSLLFDNGDIIQGNPLGDFVFQKMDLNGGDIHPMFQAMNSLGYDAATLGNHEFNYGLPFLTAALKGARFPFVCANTVLADGRSYLPPFIRLVRNFEDDHGKRQTLRIGVTGFVPPQIMNWDRGHLDGKLVAQDIVEAALRHVPVLRKSCDILIGLSHSGISPGPLKPMMENVSCQLALVPGFDAIITGHSHRVFPGSDYSATDDIDPLKGRLNGVPAVMPGFWGSHLGLIDLSLEKENGTWKVRDARSEARPVYRREQTQIIALTESAPQIAAAISVAHERTKEWIDQPVGQFNSHIHSYFVWAGYDPATAIVNAAQRDYATRLLQNSEFAAYPVLSAAAPFKAGYTPESFIDLKAGMVRLREAADLYIYPNTLVALMVSGATLVEWLEHGARNFNRIQPGDLSGTPLVDPHVPSYNFDVISGLTYEIDISQEPRTDRDGRIIHPDRHRIKNIAFREQSLKPDDKFVLVTNNYRADGGGGFPVSQTSVILRAPDANRDVVLSYIREHASGILPETSPWRFSTLGQTTQVTFQSSPLAQDLALSIQDLKPLEPLSNGFFKYSLLVS